MNDDMVMRSVYLRPSQDGHLRQLAHEHHVSKSDLIRSAISAKLEEWVADPSSKLILKDLELGRRTPAAGRIDPEPVAPVARVSAVQPKKKKAVAAPKARPERPATGRAARPAEPKTTGEPRRAMQGALEMAD